MKSKYNEIFKLKKMLEDTDIPFEWEESFGYSKHDIERLKEVAPDLIEHYHIMYPCKGKGQTIISVIQGFGAYGSEQDRLEIMGGFDPEESGGSSVLGGLTAEDVYSRIIYNYSNKERFIMKKTIKVVDEETLELKEIEVEEDVTETVIDDIVKDFQNALNCEPDEFYKKYREMKKAEADFNAIYEPFKENLIKLHEKRPDLPKSVVVGGTKLTYVSPSTRTSIDGKKLKEEEPELARKFTKISQVKATIRLEEV